MWRIYVGIVVVLALISGYFYVDKKFERLRVLEEQIITIQETQAAEREHMRRELERQQFLVDLRLRELELNTEAEQDISDVGSTFSSSRVHRLNLIR